MKLGVLASHEGTTLQSLIACGQGVINATITAVISNNGDSGALRRADAAGIPTFHLSGTTHPDSDAGPVLAHREVPVHPDDTAEALAKRVQDEERQLLVEMVGQIAGGVLQLPLADPG